MRPRRFASWTRPRRDLDFAESCARRRHRSGPARTPNVFDERDCTMPNRSLTNRLSENREGDSDSLDPAAFCELLLSRRRLLRTDWANVVVDPATGKRYE